MVLMLSGDANVLSAFERHEAGGHQWQRIPPNEKRGRIHTSTITVAVLPVPEERDLVIDPQDLDIKTCRGSGAGGQHRNVTDSAVQMTHIPTGLSVRCESERSQHQNKALALDVLRSRLNQIHADKRHETYNDIRRQQVGKGHRGGKIRTISVKNDYVINHANDKRMASKQYLRGEVDSLWD